MSFLLSWFQPTFDALNPFSSLPFSYRWRLLPFQLLVLLINSIKFFPWLFSRKYSVHYIPTRAGRHVRVIVFQPSRTHSSDDFRPLHLDVHAGGFLGGIPEYDAIFCDRLAEETGAVVVATSYRAAPQYPFPAAIDDVDDVVVYLFKNAEKLFGANPKLFTVSGFSAGSNLALAASQQEACQKPSETNIKASVTFYAPVDLRLPPWEKPKPPKYPTRDFLKPLLPLMDAYAGPVREANLSNPRLNPIVANLQMLPENMLFIIPTIDILFHEQLEFVQRMKEELTAAGIGTESRRLDARVVENQLHGWAELPSAFIDKQTRDDEFAAAFRFIRDTHRKYGWKWNA